MPSDAFFDGFSGENRVDLFSGRTAGLRYSHWIREGLLCPCKCLTSKSCVFVMLRLKNKSLYVKL